MKLKTLSRSALAALLFAAIPFASAIAVTSTPAAQAQRLTNLQTRGTAEIDRRLASLNAALSKLNASTKLSKSDKDAVIAQVSDEAGALTALRTKLAADTDLATARADVAGIVTGYRVYALLLPKARLIATADRFALVEDQLTQLHAKLQAKVDSAKAGSQSVDLIALQPSLDDMAAKIASAKTATDGLVAKLLALQPSDYNADHTVLTTHRQSLAAARADIKAARDDAKRVIDALKAGK